MNISEKVFEPRDNKHISRMVKAIEGWEEKSSMELKEPTGMFGQKTIVKSGGVKIDSDDLDSPTGAAYKKKDYRGPR